ncbi:LysR family transcriptional regulator [Parapusillimonas granuli]|uniref:LysR family transcriptional regulator n=1 Tax=Parapusillimonas granuli TaxID=380911 RepID=A0A853FWY7_9BURK|nr:LysR family transcriptional regulator [Parapusillimonas granuli]MBB5214173.1 DNA-binding transcriptional LysR family regulator [Parapusillimonas granuli]MEB2399000.1 LysR family transcriptional regulator [Alcaligenaceae bacterium]NYT50594.1 LysR family transcriptional regulator [Parapusillimonas granuli]
MSHRFDLYTLQLFIAVVEEGSIAAAAEREHIAASALSKRLSELERMLGAELFIRRARGVEATKAAHALARGARNLLHHADDLAGELSGYAQGTRGHVRIAANLSSITQFLPKELQAFLARYPDVTVDLTEMVSTDVIRAVAENTADIGIYSEADEQYALTTFPYHKDRMVLITPCDHPLASKPSVAFLDTLEYDHVGMHRGSAANKLLAREAIAANRRLKLKFQVTSYDALISMVDAGLGIGIMPVKATELYVCRGICIVPLSDAWASRRLKLCVRPAETLSAAARSLLDHLAGQVED